jgi:hypothetical protein
MESRVHSDEVRSAVYKLLAEQGKLSEPLQSIVE